MKFTFQVVRMFRRAFLLSGLFYSTFTFSQVQTVGTFTNSSNASNGYTLIFPYKSHQVYLIDNCGLKINTWETQTQSLIAYLQPNGDIIKAGINEEFGFGNPGRHGVLERYDWNGNLKWSYSIANDSINLHHDIEVMPNGNILAIAWKKLSPAQKHDLGRDANHSTAGEDLWEEVIYEIKPVGQDEAEIVWEWHVKDHLIQDIDSNGNNYGDVSDHPELLNINYAIDGSGGAWDWLHLNSIAYNAQLDQILISCLTFNEIYIIDHSTTTSENAGHSGGNANKGGDLLYRYGNPEAYDKGLAPDKLCFGQHDAHWVQAGPYAGDIIFYNNKAPFGYSSVDIIQLPWNGMSYFLETNGAYGPSSPIYSFTKPIKTDMVSPIMSSADVLPNGNLFICEATKGKFTEYSTTLNQVVWDYVNPVLPTKILKQGDFEPSVNLCFKAFKYLANYGAFSGKTLTPGDPLELEPWPSPCNGVDTTTEDSVTEDTVTGSIAWLENNVEVNFYPNPNNGQLFISGTSAAMSVAIYNSQGVLVYSSRNINLESSRGIDLKEQPNGLYIIRYNIGGYSKQKKILLLKA